MTFYNIIFGLLAVGAFREVIFALSERNAALFFMAATLSLLTFSDAIYTAIVIEGKKGRYTIEMKMLDLLSFVLLSFAVVIVNPSTNDMFEVDVTEVLGRVVDWTNLGAETLFWSLLAAYMAVLVLWNILLNRHSMILRWRPLVRWTQPVLVLVFAGMAAATAFSVGIGAPLACEYSKQACPCGGPAPECTIAASGSGVGGFRAFVFVLVAAYLLIFKRKMSAILDGKVTLEPLRYADAKEIDQCLAGVDNAGPGGAAVPSPLATRYRESTKDARYGIWQGGELVGVSFFVRDEAKPANEADEKAQTAELCLEGRADCLAEEVCEAAITLTEERGWKDHGLHVIHVNVPTTNTEAQKRYELLGFTTPAPGGAAEFVSMEKSRPRGRIDRVAKCIRDCLRGCFLSG